METKQCKKCGAKKPTIEFHRSDAVRGYLSATCKACDRDTARQYYHDHPEHAERVRQRSRAKYGGNLPVEPKPPRATLSPEERRAAHAAYMREYMATHPEARQRASERSRRWLESHPVPTEERRQYISDWQKANPVPRDRKRRNEMRSLYGIGPDDYKRMLDEQNGKCAICRSEYSGRKKPPVKWGLGVLAIDHDHTTGKVRGLLCHSCNVRVGACERLLADIGLEGMMMYLARGKEATEEIG